MKGKFTAGRLLQRWRIALGRMPGWKFAALVFIVSFAAKAIALLLFGVTTGIEDADIDPERARRIGWFVVVIVAPLAETLIAQALVIWLVRKALGTRVKHQLRHVPELVFRVDDSLEYISTIDKLLKE